LNTSTLEELLEVKLEGPSLSESSAAAAVELWWKDSSRRVNEKPQKRYKRKHKQMISGEAPPVSSCSNDSDDCELLNLWDDWFDFNSGDEIVSASSNGESNSDSEQEVSS